MKNFKGILLCIFIALPSWFLGKWIPVVGGPVFAILFGMFLGMILKNREDFDLGIKFTSKKILQYAVVLLGFGLNVDDILKSGKETLPIILATVSVALITAYLSNKIFKIEKDTATLIGVGSSICGGSAIAAASQAISAKDEDIAKSISVIFLFNVIAALIFPHLGGLLEMSDYGFGVFSGTAVNDTSSVTAAASAWDNIHNSNSLEVATVVKLTRTLMIIPITAFLAFMKRKENMDQEDKFNIVSIFPTFIIFFLLASFITSIVELPIGMLHIIKDTSKFFIIMAMGAIGLNTNFINLIKKGGRPIFLGFLCWIFISLSSIFMQKLLGLL